MITGLGWTLRRRGRRRPINGGVALKISFVGLNVLQTFTFHQHPPRTLHDPLQEALLQTPKASSLQIFVYDAIIMSIPGLSIPGLALSNPSFQPQAPTATIPRYHNLNPETEFRFECAFNSELTIKLISGTAELFGTELAPNTDYKFKGTKAAIFTWQGCRLEIIGATEGEYVAEETPMAQYVNTHFALENARVASQHHKGMGPRVLVVGPENSGKTSLIKMLTAYAVKSGRQPVVVNLDPQQALLSVPGALTASTFASLLDVEEGWGSSPISGPSSVPVKMPLCYQYGCQTAEENVKLYRALVTRLALAVTSRLEADQDVKASGCFIDTPGSISSGKGNNYEQLQHIASEFSGTTA
jgi:polyribonucleotide 5'-hydroxyl-kinase